MLPTPEDYASARLLSYVHYQWPGYRDAPHHRLVCRKLEAVERGEIDRLIITLPPRHGKSLLASTYFPAWYLGRNPDRYVVTAAYGQELADDFGRQVKNQIDDKLFKEIFPHVELAGDSRAARRFEVDGVAGGSEVETNRRGAYYAVGVGGPLTGRGAHLMVIDDPVRNREDADSELMRKRVREWYTSTAYTRLMPGGAIVVIQTRWHMDDLTGWLLAEHADEGWEVIDLPAIAEAGDLLGRPVGAALWPEQYDEAALDRIRLAVGPRDWSALYQQRPAPETGDYFKREWIHEVDQLPPPEAMSIYGASDYAVTSKGGDYTVHVVGGLTHDGRLYLLDVWREQAASDVWVEAFCDLVLKWRPIGWAEETGQIKSGVGPFLARRMMERRAYVARERFPTRGDKATRAQSIRGRMALHGLYVPRGAPWLPDVLSELLSFPVGVHDDQCVIEGTLIAMADGSSRQIEDVCAGDLVLTHEGPRPVVASEITSENASVCEISLSNGERLICTPNHPVFVRGRGFTRADELRIADQLALVGDELCAGDHLRARSWNTGAIDTVDTRTARAERTRDTSTARSRAVGSCTATCGKMRTAPSRLATKSITLMKTLPTMLWRISNAFLPKTIERVTRLRKPRCSGSWCTLRTSGRWRQSGTPRPKDWLGTPRTGKPVGRVASLFGRNARRAGSLSTRGSTALCIVPVAANSGALAADRVSAGATSGKEQPFRASAANVSLSQSGQTAQNTAARRVVCVTGLKALSVKARVRNLSVSGAHTFYANGVLTHNCDALGLLGQLLDRMAPGPDLTPRPERPKPMTITPGQVVAPPLPKLARR